MGFKLIFKHYTCKENITLLVQLHLLLHLSNINNYKQSSATGIWNDPYSVRCQAQTSLFFAPLVLFAYLGFFLFGKVILDIEGLADFLWCFPLNHICNSLAGHIE